MLIIPTGYSNSPGRGHRAGRTADSSPAPAGGGVLSRCTKITPRCKAVAGMTGASPDLRMRRYDAGSLAARPDARRNRLTDTDADLYRDGRRAHRLAARRPDRHRAARRDYAVGHRRDDARRFRVGGELVDHGAAVRDDDHLGAIRR